MIDQNFDPISDTIYAVDTISQLPNRLPRYDPFVFKPQDGNLSDYG